MIDLSGYSTKFSRNPFLGLWTYVTTTPDGGKLHPLGLYISDGAAQTAALRQIEMHQAQYTLTGDKLKEKVNGQ